MVISPIELLSALALLLLVTGIAGATYRAVWLLAHLIPPRPHWVTRGVLLVAIAGTYLLFVAVDIPGLLAAIAQPQGLPTPHTVARTALLGTWFWVMTTILLMLARGKLGSRPVWRQT